MHHSPRSAAPALCDSLLHLGMFTGILGSHWNLVWTQGPEQEASRKCSSFVTKDYVYDQRAAGEA